MFIRDIVIGHNEKGKDNVKKGQHEAVEVSRNDRPELHEESKPEGRVHSNRSPVPTEDSD
tara:strand:- start:20 stop:199 length:180 start_codon:yes stop_codon:yes gene_type:complete